MVVAQRKLSKRQWRTIFSILLCLLFLIIIYNMLKLLFIERTDKFTVSLVNNVVEERKQTLNFPSSSLNLNKDIDLQRFFFNRHAKSGQASLTTLMERLAHRYGYKYTPMTAMPRTNESFLSIDQQRRLVAHISNEPITPCSFDIMVPFIDFTKYGESLPIYFSMVRDPVELYISSYSVYIGIVISRTYAGNTEESFKVNPQEIMKAYSLEDCIMRQEPRCTPKTGRINPITSVGHFCGDDFECWVQNSRWALQTAKNNIDRAYKVVGVIEYMNETIAVLEDILPHFFTGMVEEYNKGDFTVQSNRWRVNISENARKMLKDNLSGDYELYNFLVNRLHNQYNKIGQYE